MREVEIGGKKYSLKLSYNQQKAWQERFNKNFEDMGDEMNVEECIALVFHGLKAGATIGRTELDLEEDDLGDMLDQVEIIKYVQYLIMDISKSVQELTDNAEGVKKKEIK